MVLGVVVLSLSGCSLFYDPCGELENKLCADLGSDCATFSDTPSIRDVFIPARRRQAERVQCEMFADEVNYAGYTLPQTKYLIAAQRDPTTPAPQLAKLRVAGLSSSVSGPWLYALPLVFIPGLFLYSWFMRRKLTRGSPER